MDKELIKKVKEKREFSELPDSIVSRAFEQCGEDVKEARKVLRKYFGVFLTNRILKGKGSAEEILKAHMSSKKRDYEEFYRRVFEGLENVNSIIDLGAGVNGFSYPYLSSVVGDVDYVAVEASGQIVENMNKFFKENKFHALGIQADLFDLDFIKETLKKQKKNRVVFMFQIIDALENLEKDFSKRFIEEISRECEYIVLSFPLVSLGARKKFAVKRKWLLDFLNENFVIENDFEMNGERVIRFRPC